MQFLSSYRRGKCHPVITHSHSQPGSETASRDTLFTMLLFGCQKCEHVQSPRASNDLIVLSSLAPALSFGAVPACTLSRISVFPSTYICVSPSRLFVCPLLYKYNCRSRFFIGICAVPFCYATDPYLKARCH